MTELEHLRIVVANLREDLARVTAERDRLRAADWVLWDLWGREVRPGWRMWRIKRRRTATIRNHEGATT